VPRIYFCLSFAVTARETNMADEFEDHCWKDAVPADVLELYAHYRREVFVGPSPALLAIDLYELGGAHLEALNMKHEKDKLT